MVLHGSCLCGGIKYEVDIDEEASRRTSSCHCRVCRKITSGTTSLNLAVPPSAFKLTSGELKTFETKHFDDGFGMSVAFCGNCSSTIYATAEVAPLVIIQVGTLDDKGPIEAKPVAELNINHRLDWLPPLEGAAQNRTYLP